MEKTLFNQTAVTRRDDPIGSHVAADKMNADNRKKLNRQLLAVLKAVRDYPGHTAKQLGEIMAESGRGQYGWAWRRSKQLEDLDYICRDPHPKQHELICYITHRGESVLDSLD